MDAVIISDQSDVLANRGEISEVFPFASVTKLFASYATLIAVERHLTDLDAPAGPATVRHVLGHASGLPFAEGAVMSEPGTRRVYSNKGIEVLGEKVAEDVGMPFSEWMEETVLEPLGLSSILIEGSPAYSGEGNAEDLAAFARELMHPTLVSAEMMAEATTRSFGELSGVLPGFGRQKDNAWGLGFEIRSNKDPHWLHESFSPATFGHFGQSGSFLWVDPEIGLSGVYLGDTNFSDAHKKFWPELTKAMRDKEIPEIYLEDFAD